MKMLGNFFIHAVEGLLNTLQNITLQLQRICNYRFIPLKSKMFVIATSHKPLEMDISNFFLMRSVHLGVLSIHFYRKVSFFQLLPMKLLNIQ